MSVKRMSSDYKTLTQQGKAKISINIDKGILEKIDLDVKSRGTTRSDWFAIASMYFLQKEEHLKKEKEHLNK